MPLQEDRITNLLYLVSQTKTITVPDHIDIEKRRTIMQMTKLGLLKQVGSKLYGLDTLGEKIVNSKKSFTQYMACLNDPDYIEDPVDGSDQDTDLKRYFKIGIILALVLTVGGLIYWLGFRN